MRTPWWTPSLSLALAVVWLGACSGARASEPGADRPTSPPTTSRPSVEPSLPEGRCNDNSDCRSGEICEGEGCGDAEGVCVSEVRACTRDLVPYCDCAGSTFRASGSCPERRFSRRGACEGDATETADAPTEG